MTPLAVLKESAGKPCMFQSWTVGGSAKKPQKSKFSLAGMLSCLTCSGRKRVHISVMCSYSQLVHMLMMNSFATYALYVPAGHAIFSTAKPTCFILLHPDKPAGSMCL